MMENEAGRMDTNESQMTIQCIDLLFYARFDGYFCFGLWLN